MPHSGSSGDDDFEVDETQIIPRTAAPEPPLVVVRTVTSPPRFVVPDAHQARTVGRSPHADLSLQHPSVSRVHARLEVEPSGALSLTDLESTNGTFVNQTPVTGTVRLEPGDRIVLGTVPLAVERLSPSELADLQRLSHRIDAATRDALTGFATRHWLYDELATWLELRRAREEAASCLFVDLDNLKEVNDTSGHAAGDAVLRFVCERIREVIRDGDVGVRYGGDEFVVLLGRCRTPEAVQVANRIRGAVRAQSVADVGPITVSIGVAELRRGESSESWIARADKALYRAKGHRDRTEVD